MTTYGDVVDRVFRDWLHGPDEQPIVASLSGAINDSVTSITLDLTALEPEEQDAFAKGLILECEYEQMLVQTLTGQSTATVVRGYNSTTAASHANDANVVLLPSWGRQTVLDAVLDEVPRLYPDLHATKQTSVTTDSAYVEVPADVVTITKAYLQDGNFWKTTSDVELLTDFSPSSTDKAIQTRHTPSGKTLHLAYRGTFARPSAATDTLADSKVEEAWVPILCVGAVASLIASEGIDDISVEYVTRQLEQQQFPVGSASRLRDGLLRYRNFLLDQARRTQRADDQTAIVQRQAVWP